MTHNMQPLELVHMAIQELDRARTVYPEWPTSVVEAAAVMMEEAGEVLKAANDLRWGQNGGTVADVRKEAIQTMAMCLRLLLDTPILQGEDHAA